MKIETTTIVEEVLLRIRKTGRKTVSRRTIVRNLDKVLQYVIDSIEQELQTEGIEVKK